MKKLYRGSIVVFLCVALIVPSFWVHAQTQSQYIYVSEADIIASLIARLNELKQRLIALGATYTESEYVPPNTSLPRSSEEAFIEDYEMDGSYSVREDDRNVTIGTIELTLEESDAELIRVDVVVDPVTRDIEDDPDDVFEQLWIEHDGDRGDERDTSSKSAWSDSEGFDADSDEEYRVRLSGAGLVLEEGRVRIKIVADIASGIKGDEQEWEVFVPENGLRVRSPSGLYESLGDPDERAIVTIRER